MLREIVSLGALRATVTHPRWWLRLPGYIADLLRYRREERRSGASLARLRIYPQLGDKQQSQSAHSNYFYQDCWAAGEVFREAPSWGVDLGSTVLLVGILSQFRPWVSVDIRPIDAALQGLECKAGSVLALPYDDGEVPCITTMCVLEHIGLGRYGDPLNPAGTLQAASEIARVLQPGGIVIYSVPVGRELLEFNAHRRFTYEGARNLFRSFSLVNACILTPTPAPYTNDAALAKLADPVSCFCLRKPAETPA